MKFILQSQKQLYTMHPKNKLNCRMVFYTNISNHKIRKFKLYGHLFSAQCFKCLHKPSFEMSKSHSYKDYLYFLFLFLFENILRLPVVLPLLVSAFAFPIVMLQLRK